MRDLKDSHPRLIYCSITGFGQTGPYAPRAGYDLLAQGIGGIMSVTGEPDRPPMKVGVGIADVMCGMYATVAILARAASPRQDRPGPVYRPRAAGYAGGLADQCRAELPDVRQGAAAGRQRAPEHRAVQRAARRRRYSSSWRSATTRSSRSSAISPARRSWPRIRASSPTPTACETGGRSMSCCRR